MKTDMQEDIKKQGRKTTIKGPWWMELKNKHDSHKRGILVGVSINNWKTLNAS